MQLEYEDPRTFASPSVRLKLPDAEPSSQPEEAEEDDEGEAAAEPSGESAFPLTSSLDPWLLSLQRVTASCPSRCLLITQLPALSAFNVIAHRPPAHSSHRPERKEETHHQTTPIPRREATRHDHLPDQPGQAHHQGRQGAGHDDERGELHGRGRYGRSSAFLPSAATA